MVILRNPETRMRTKQGLSQSTLIGTLVVVLAAGAGLAAFLFLDSGEPLTPLGPEYRYDLSGFAAIDPALIVYEQRGLDIATDMKQSRAIIVSPSGTVLVAGDRKIIELNADGRVRSEERRGG